jgi:hypothetical protein
MKKSVPVLLICLLIFSFIGFGCASAPSAGPGADSNEMPPWLNELPPENALWGIGIAKQSNLAMSKTTAEARGRVSIAQQLNSYIQAMFIDYNRDAGANGSQANISLQESISRQVTNMQLTGATPVRNWVAKDGTYWVLIECPKSTVKDSVSSIIDNEAAQYAEFKASQALDMLDAQLAKNDKPLQTNN